MSTAELSPREAERLAGRPPAAALVAPFTAVGAAVSITVAVVTALVLGLPLVAVAGATIVAGLGFGTAIALLPRHHGFARLGVANIVTSARLGMVAVLTGLLLAGSPLPLVLIGIAVVALSLDGVDGAWARRQGLSSRFGAQFDMEVDSLFALVLAALAALGPAGPLALVLGLPRYLFGAAAVPLPWLNGALPERYSRKVVCVVQLIGLIALQLPGLPMALAVGITIVVLALLAWSFGLDIAHLRRTRA